VIDLAASDESEIKGTGFGSGGERSDVSELADVIGHDKEAA
jgi:hypothetical protein